MNLTDICRLRANEISRELAGCVGIDPLWTLSKLERLQPQALSDELARRFILGVKEKLIELQTATPDQQAEIVVQIASDNNLLMDYISWITIPRNLYQDVPAAIHELQALAITLHEMENLLDWIKAREEYVNGR
jgi:hypothetical protein